MSHKPQLVMLHGWGSSARVWDGINAELSHDFELLQPELPGHGVSHFTATGLPELAQQILDSLDDVLQPSAHWLGWSLGGLIAMQAALLNPQAFRSLLLVAATPAFVQRDDWQMAMPQAEFDAFESGFQQDVEKTLKRFISLQAQGDANRRVVIQSLKSASASPATDLFWGLEMLRDVSLLEQIGNISCPVSALYGEQDALVPAAITDQLTLMGSDPFCTVCLQKGGDKSMENKSSLTLLKTTVWPDVGHVPFLSRPDAFYQWVRDMAV